MNYNSAKSRKTVLYSKKPRERNCRLRTSRVSFAQSRTKHLIKDYNTSLVNEADCCNNDCGRLKHIIFWSVQYIKSQQLKN